MATWPEAVLADQAVELSKTWHDKREVVDENRFFFHQENFSNAKTKVFLYVFVPLRSRPFGQHKPRSRIGDIWGPTTMMSFPS